MMNLSYPNYISWNHSHKSKGFKLRIQQLLAAAAAKSNLTLRPSSLIFFFANGISTNVYHKLRDEFGASEIRFEGTEGDWINVIARSYRDACVLEINPAGDNDVVPTSQVEVSVGKAETRLHLLKHEGIEIKLGTETRRDGVVVGKTCVIQWRDYVLVVHFKIK